MLDDRDTRIRVQSHNAYATRGKGDLLRKQLSVVSDFMIVSADTVKSSMPNNMFLIIYLIVLLVTKIRIYSECT